MVWSSFSASRTGKPLGSDMNDPPAVSEITSPLLELCNLFESKPTGSRNRHSSRCNRISVATSVLWYHQRTAQHPPGPWLATCRSRATSCSHGYCPTSAVMAASTRFESLDIRTSSEASRGLSNASFTLLLTGLLKPASVNALFTLSARSVSGVKGGSE